MKQIVISDPVRLVAAVHFARDNGCEADLALSFLRLLEVCAAGMWLKPADGDYEATPGDDRAEIGYDFAPLSFSFVTTHGGERGLVGGFIYSGPTAPGDGSAPSFSVNLNWVTGQAPKHSWSIHT